MKQQKGKGGGSKLARWLGAPVRALSRACDSYVRHMSACAGRIPTQAGAAGVRGFAPMMPGAAGFNSRSRRGDDEDVDVEALVRAMSLRQASTRRAGGGAVAPIRSRSVAVGRIDEDAPCEFGADDDDLRIGAGPLTRPGVRRARSVAVGAGGGFGFGSGAAKRVVRGG